MIGGWLLASILPLRVLATPTIDELFAEREQAVVGVTFTIAREIDRQRQNVVGLVVDEEGLIVLLGGSIAEWLPPGRITELRVHLPRSAGEGYAAEYLGQDYLNGWHYLRVEEAAWAKLRSITTFPTAEPSTGTPLWGICMTDENLDYLPYFRDARLSAAQAFPLLTGFLTDDVATPGSAVFDFEGHFVGWAGQGNPVEREMWIGGEVYRVSLRNNAESHAFLFARDFLANIGRVPASPIGGERPWLGLSGLRPIDRDTAEFLGLEEQGAVLVSDVIAGSPAEAAGFAPRDIVVAIDGARLPRFKPDSVVQTYLERAIRGARIGGSMAFTIVRGESEEELTATFVTAPKLLREAEQAYLEALGFTIREVVMDDALQRRVEFSTMGGVIAAFVKPNSPPSAAGLEPGDWILEVDGRAVEDFSSGFAALEAIAESESGGQEYVLLIRRNNETSVLHVQRN